MKDNQHTIFQTPIWGFMLNDQQYQSMDYRDYILEMSEKNQVQRKATLVAGSQEITFMRLKEFFVSLLHH